MKKEKLEEFFNNINNAEDLIMYHLFKRGWKFVNVFKSGIMTKGNVFFVIKKYANTNTYDNFMFTENDLDITQINSIQDLKNTDIPLRKNFSPVNTDKCSWYVSYKDKIVEKGLSIDLRFQYLNISAQQISYNLINLTKHTINRHLKTQ